MKTFSEQIKMEVAKQKTVSPEQAISYLSAIIKTAGEIRRNRSGETIVVFTELTEVYAKVNNLLQLLYGEAAELNLSEEQAFAKSGRYEILFSPELSKKVMEDAELFEYDENHYPILLSGISKYLVEDEESAKSYIAGAMLGCFTCDIAISHETNRNTNGYHAEFVFTNDAVASDFAALLAQFDILAKKVIRKNFFVVYIKELESISNLFALVGASNAVIRLQNESTVREVRNQVNRQNNCYTGNVTKAVDASLKQLENIKIILSTIGLDNLEKSLQDAANLRLANPEENLEGLVKLNKEKITKSGLYHRFQKLEKIANELKE